MTQHRPNILFVLADDLGQGDVSCFNPEAQWETPYVDRVAAEGMRFTDSHATSALCTPSRYGALTGRYNWRSRLKSMVLTGDSETLIEHDRSTLPTMLQDQGYRTAVVGKWHLGLDWQLREGGDSYESFGVNPEEHPMPENRIGRDGNFDANRWHDVEGTDIDYSKPVQRGPNQMGFDYSFITAASLDQPPYVYIENGQPQGIPTVFGGDQYTLDRRTDAHQQQIQKGPMVEGYDVNQVAQDFQDKTLDVLDDFLAGDEPWFLYAPSHLVHGPIIPNKPWQGRSGISAYGDFVLQLDEYFGQMVAKIDDAGAAEDTIVIFTSDNGASGVAGLPSLRAEGHDPSNGWRGHKTDIWEGGHREPFVVRWPGRIEAGSTSHQMVTHADLYATVAELLDVEIPGNVAEDSVSGLSLWLGDEQPVRDHLVSHSGGGGFAIRRGDWKLEFTTTGDGMDAMYEVATGGEQTKYEAAQLYDLASDPAENNNVIDQHPQLVAELTELLAELISSGRSTPGPEQPNMRNNPDGEWPQIGWMPNAEEVVKNSRVR